MVIDEYGKAMLLIECLSTVDTHKIASISRIQSRCGHSMTPVKCICCYQPMLSFL